MVLFELRKKARCRNKTEAAFTLLELLVVCFLISIMLLVSVPALRDTFLTDPLKSTTRKIIGTVRSLRGEAIRSRQSFILSFDLDHKRIKYKKDIEQKINQQDLDEKKNPVETDTTVVDLPSSVQIMDVWTKSDGKQTQGTVDLWISPQGYMDMTVVHITDDNETLSIFFSPFLASIKVVGGYADLQ